MFINTAVLLSLVGLASATAVPRQSSPFGRLHPYEKGTELCVAASEPTVGAIVGLVKCHASTDEGSKLELYNITNSGTYNKQRIALQAYPGLCLDGGARAQASDQITLQRCDKPNSTNGQLISYSTAGYLSFQNTYCFHKKSDSEIDIQSCFLMNQEIVFYPS
ncbi:hypothetical protein I317_06413 [Kwoniella heveanensis CBS 569]|nr:hypothetical protein I317_06413 [Kwoniella heveanensis CBS 569]